MTFLKVLFVVEQLKIELCLVNKLGELKIKTPAKAGVFLCIIL